MYAELQCKTGFSFLRGASDAGEYVERAAALGLRAIAITDVNGVYALPRAFEALRRLPGHVPAPKLISGCELKLQGQEPLTLLARDRKAYGLMCRMITAAHFGKEKGAAELALPELERFLSSDDGRGLIALASQGFGDLGRLKALFEDRLFVTLSRVLDGMDGARTAAALWAAGTHGLRIVGTNDVHYHIAERQRLQDALTCVREGVTLATAGFKIFPNAERRLKSPLEMRALFGDLPEAIETGLEIAESCSFSLSELSYRYPSEWIPKGLSAEQFLENLVQEGARARYPGGVPAETLAQIRHELALIGKLGYADYFLTVYDIVAFAEKSGIYCQGRGAAANSVVCYCLGITVVDPVKMGLLFERFVSEERGEPPDIDVDFEHERREEVIQYIYNKYGRDRAAMVAAVRTYRRRSAFLEMSKAVGVAVGTISAGELERDFERHAGELVSKRDKIDALVSELKGFPRHLSIHSCGFTLSAGPIIDTVPVEPARMEGRTICQWDKHDLDTVGLIKIDVLGLGFLSAIHKACDLIGIHFREIPQRDDPEVYAMIQASDTIGTFQIESRAQISMLGVTQPENFYDLVVEVALVRPGPNVGEMKGPYLTRREKARRGIPYVFDDPVTERILKRTYGVPIFQEQVMRLAVEKAGFTPGEADELRRAIAAWRSAAAVDGLSERFYRGLVMGGMAEEKARELFGYMKGFAAYGFPESHAASFATLSYLSAWLKRYHPAELLCGLLNSQPMGFYPIDVLMNDAIRHGVRVLPLDPNASDWDAQMEPTVMGKGVRMGFRNVDGIRKSDVLALTQARKSAPFQSIHDFLARTRFSRDVVETLAMADVFAPFGFDQRHSFWKSLEAPAQPDLFGQPDLFAERDLGAPAGRVFEPLTLFEGIREDYRGLGYSLKGHAMKGLRAAADGISARLVGTLTSEQVKRLPHGARAAYAGIVLALQRPPTAKGVAFMTLEDEHGSVDLVFFKKTYERFEAVIRGSRLLLARGRIERQGKSLSLIVSQVSSFEGVGEGVASSRPITPGEHSRGIR